MLRTLQLVEDLVLFLNCCDKPLPHLEMQRDPCQYLGSFEGFGDVIYCAGGKTGNLAFGSGKGGNKDHRDVGSARIRLENPACRETVFPRHRDVEQYHGGLVLLRQTPPFLT